MFFSRVLASSLSLSWRLRELERRLQRRPVALPSRGLGRRLALHLAAQLPAVDHQAHRRDLEILGQVSRLDGEGGDV